MTHASVTNLLLFHRFLEQNAHYRASMRLPPLEPEQPAAIEAAPAIEELTTPNLPGDDEEGDEDEEEDLTRPTSDWNLDFGPMSEEELMVGHVIKDRLLRLLDHPELRNHLLKRKNLLVLLVSHAQCYSGIALIAGMAGPPHASSPTSDHAAYRSARA